MKSKTLLYRTLVFSLYPDKLAPNCFLATGPSLVLKTGELAKRFRISVSRMKDQLKDLEDMGFIKDLVIERYFAHYVIVREADHAIVKETLGGQESGNI